MQHDTEWLAENNPFHAESGVNSADDFDEMARDYAEHMMRWRPITEKPAEGQIIECLIDGNHAIELWEYRQRTTKLRHFAGWRPFHGKEQK